MEKDLLQGFSPRVFGTQVEDPWNGRVFVWGKMGWYERLEGESGAVAFSPIAHSEEALRRQLHAEGAPALVDLDDDFASLVIQEFSEQVPLYPESPELSDEKPFREQQTD